MSIRACFRVAAKTMGDWVALVQEFTDSEHEMNGQTARRFFAPVALNDRLSTLHLVGNWPNLFQEPTKLRL